MKKSEKILGLVYREEDDCLTGMEIFNWLSYHFQGKGTYSGSCKISGRVYFLNSLSEISSIAEQGIDKEKFVIMTIEEFEKKFHYKLGDVVYVKDTPYFGSITKMYWHRYNHTMMYRISHGNMTVDAPASSVSYVYKSC